MVADNDPPGADREADVYAVLAILWRQKTFVALMCVLFIGLGVVYCVSTKEWFRAEVLLRPADTKTNQGLSSQIGSLGGLASLAGFAVNKDASAEALAVLTSREFTGKFIEEEKLLPLFFPNEWDDAKKQWRPARFSRVPEHGRCRVHRLPSMRKQPVRRGRRLPARQARRTCRIAWNS